MRQKATVVRHGDELTILCAGAGHRLVIDDPPPPACRSEKGRLADRADAGQGGGDQRQAGRTVSRGAALMVMVAMKMEHTITAPADGTVATVHYDVGEQVEEGAVLLAISDAT